MAGNRKIVSHFIEVSTLGFTAEISDVTKALKIPMMADNLKRSIVIAALKSSFIIYCNRNNAAIDVTLNLVHPVFVLYLSINSMSKTVLSRVNACCNLAHNAFTLVL